MLIHEMKSFLAFLRCYSMGLHKPAQGPSQHCPGNEDFTSALVPL